MRYQRCSRCIARPSEPNELLDLIRQSQAAGEPAAGRRPPNRTCHPRRRERCRSRSRSRSNQDFQLFTGEGRQGFSFFEVVDQAFTGPLFAQVVQARSFSQAAQRANLAESAVSKRIARLEERLGVRLLTRTTRKLSMTPEGLRFYEHCAQLVCAAEAAEESISSARRIARGRLTVNAPSRPSCSAIPRSSWT